MPLSLNEIKDRALAFSREWEGEVAERAEAQTFWNEFFNVFGVNRRQIASFEEPVKRARKRFEDIVYNHSPWPDHPRLASSAPPPILGGGRGVVAFIEEAAQAVLDAHAAHPDASLADLYAPVAMPPNLRKAHQALDKAVDAAYACPEQGRRGKKTFASDAERVAFLFELYHKYTSLLPGPEVKPHKKKR